MLTKLSLVQAGMACAIVAWSMMIGCSKKEEQRSETTATSIGPESSAIKPVLDKGWCGGHGVPESVCTRWANDWCAEHGLPESQCTICNPEVREKWAALRPAGSVSVDDELENLRLERSPRLLTGTGDPLCQVDTLRVRFVDPSIVRKAGIEVERVRRRAMSATLEVPAEVEFDATSLTRVAPLVAGVVREVPAELGSIISVGDLLAVIDSPVLGEAKSQFIERKQDLKLAEADLERVSTIFRGIQQMLKVCTSDVETEQVLEALAESPVGDAKARLLRAHAALQLARLEAKRAATLQKQKITSEQKYQTAQSALVAAKAEFVALREEINFKADQERLSAERGVEVARSALEAVERRLHILGLNGKQIDSIGTEPDEQLSRFELRSPVAGRVIERDVAVGESVKADDKLFIIVNTSEMWLMADVYERDLLQLRTGLPVHFTVDGMPGMSFEGNVTWISSQVSDRTRTVRLRAELPNSDGLLRAKMFGQARIVLHKNEEVVSIPADAVQTDGCCQLVFVQESETVFEPRKIALGASANGFVEVLRGLNVGEAVASVGSFLMKTEILKGSIGAGCCEVEPGR
jgi:cobalt-zinc-cadmium efflux system membrane fusion protein